MPEVDVTIVTPSLNQGEFIEQTIKSVLSQRGPIVKYIVVDGFSQDGTVEVFDRYCRSIHEIIVEKDDGHADAIKQGFALANGQFVVI